MSIPTGPRPGQPPDPSQIIDPEALVQAYYSRVPDMSVPEERVAFGTSGHRGSPLRTSFNESHILAITQAIAVHRKRERITGPLFLGYDSHAVSRPAFETALEVLAANEVEVQVAADDELTPTPAVSHAILTHNRGLKDGRADGIVITPSHNPPEDGGFKYDPPEGGPAPSAVTAWIEHKANQLLEGGLLGVARIPFERAERSWTTGRYDFLGRYVDDLARVVDMEAIRDAGLKLGVDPLGGASVHYWGRIAERYGLDLAVVDETVDPTFRFMTVDWDGRIRMDPSSPPAMQRLLGLKDRFDVAFACDPDADRHGVVTRAAGLMPPNHFLAVAVDHLFRHRPGWRPDAAVGKTLVSSRMIDLVAARLGLRLFETPVGFKWFVHGLLDGSLGFAGEESAGASFLRRDGTVWTTDKDGLIPALLAAEITARRGRDPGELYRDLARDLGDPVYDRIDAPATPEQRSALARLTPDRVRFTDLAGEKIEAVLTTAPGNGAPIGGIKVIAPSGWFAARPSGTESITKIYAESFRGDEHLRRIVDEARSLLAAALGESGDAAGSAVRSERPRAAR